MNNLIPRADEPTITIGDINTQIDGLQGFKVTRDFLHYLGFNGVYIGVRHEYLAADFPKIVAAIIEHLRGLK